MKLLRLNKTVRVRFNPYIITSNRLLLIKICVELFFSILLLSTWFSPYSIPVKSVLSLIFVGMVYSIEKIFRSTFIRKIQSVLYVRESLFDMLISLSLFEEDDNVVINSATLHFDITSDNNLIITVPLFGNKFLKLLKNLDEYLIPTLGLPLISKQEFPDYVIYRLGNEEIQQYVFNSHTLTKEFFEDNPSPIIKLSNTQQFSLKSNTNLGIYGRTGTGKTIALQWYLFNALAKGCGTTDHTYLGVVDGKSADLFALGKLLQEELGEQQIAVGSSPQMLAKLSREFVDIMNERFEIIERNSTLNADAYDLEMTPNFLFVDELASIRDSCGSSKQGKELWNEILQNLGLIARKGRQAGCHLCLSTQDPNAENIPVELRNQISAVLYLGNIGNDRLKMAFSMCELENVPTISDRKGEALFYADGINSAEPVLTIVPFVDVKTKQDFLQVVRNILPYY